MWRAQHPWFIRTGGAPPPLWVEAAGGVAPGGPTAALAKKRPNRGGGAAASTPPASSPTPAETGTATPAEILLFNAPTVPAPDGGSDLVPGTYYLTAPTYPARISFTVPAGWWHWQASQDVNGILVDSGPDAPQGSGWGVLFSVVGNVNLVPCPDRVGSVDLTPVTSVDALLEAAATWQGFRVTNDEPIAIDGFTGQRVTITTTHTKDDCLGPVLWTAPHGGFAYDGYPMFGEGAHPAESLLLDVAGTVLAVRATDFPETSPFEIEGGVTLDPTRHAADQTELHQILDSIRITLE